MKKCEECGKDKVDDGLDLCFECCNRLRETLREMED